MEIIKRGINTDPYKVECHNCGCVFTYSESDVFWNRITFADVVKCPEKRCGQEIFHNKVKNLKEHDTI